MSTMMTNSTRRISEHFEPEPSLDPVEQRKLRGHLEQIDYAAYAANCTVVAQVLGRAELSRFERLAVAAAQARARWVAAAIAMSEGATALSPDQVSELAALRRSFEELTDAYEAMRRLVERGYLGYQPNG
jgi:long-subunit acyl-CoA synthetase (AMP-forming)